MYLTLTDEQRQALEARGDGPVRIHDGQTNKTYVLLPAELYERVQGLIESAGLSLAEKRQLLAEAGRRAGWQDPEMDVYDNYDAHRLKP